MEEVAGAAEVGVGAAEEDAGAAVEEGVAEEVGAAGGASTSSNASANRSCVCPLTLLHSNRS